MAYHPISRNKLANSPHYREILKRYNEEFDKTNGKVVDKVFWKEVIVPLIPDYKLMSWYQFLRRWKDSMGLRAVLAKPLLPSTVPDLQEQDEFAQRMLSNAEATQQGIKNALNVGTRALMELINNPEFLQKLPLKDQVELLFKAMRAQDSRIFALGKVREDKREQDKFDHVFRDSVGGDEEEES